MKKYYLVLVWAAFCFPYGESKAQIMFSNGAVVQINAGATVITNGGLEISDTSAFTNNGLLTITKNSTFPSPGNFELNTGANVTGTGTYRIEQDWINDATFTASTSSVELFGNTQQFITSTTGTSTTFNDLDLLGAGVGANRKKTLLNVNASVHATGSLTINDRELETQTNTFFVLNPTPGAVSNITTPGSEGFVSSIAPGTFRV